MAPPPSYVPALWRRRSPFLDWLAAKPSRVVGWYCVYPLIPIAFIVGGAVGGSLAFVVIGGIVTLAIAGEAAIYVPRALRAMRQPDPN